jgi:hypothetical protein
MTGKKKNTKPIEALMSEALMRSGYTLESRIISKLVQRDFFVEPNQRILDPRTGKSREIDLIAELFEYDREAQDGLKHKILVSTYFVCEAKNNPYPIALLTELPFSPGLPAWESMHEGKTGFFRDNDLETSFYNFLTEEQKVYTQYCSFRPKKGNNGSEWMALHPDDFYDDLEKIILYCRFEAERVTAIEDDHHRLLLHLPVVILGGDLFVAEPTEEKIHIRKVDTALYMHFDIQDKEQSLSLVVFVTEKYFLMLFEKIIQFGNSIEAKITAQLKAEGS